MTCKNCQEHLQDSDKFCNHCGAKVINHRLTLRYLFSEVSNGFLNIDSSRPFRTFIDMFRKPEDVIVGYINGTRKKYINAFGYFTIALTLAGLYLFIVQRFFPELMDELMNVQQTEMQKNMNKTMLDTMFEYQALIFFATIPFLALISRLIFWKNKQFNYTEHLVLNLYTYSHGSIIYYLLTFCLIWIPTLQAALTFGSMIIYIALYFHVLKRVYDIEAGPMVLKTFLFLVILGFVFFIAMIIGGIIMYNQGLLDQMIEEAKQNAKAAGMIIQLLP